MTVSITPDATRLVVGADAIKPLDIRRLPSTRRRRPRRLTADRLDALTGDRDRVVDLLRLVSLLMVIAGHSIMLTVTVSGGHIELGNLLGDVPMLQVATWLLQILPLFFFAGAAAATYGWHAAPRGSSTAGHWLFARAQRLLRPVFWYVLIVGAVLGVFAALGNSTMVDVVARLGVQLLWFLGAYLLILSLVPLMQRITTVTGLVGAVLVCYGVTALMDVLRLSTGAQEWGYANYLAVWMIPALIGVGYANRLIRPTTAGLVAGAMLAVNAALVVIGPYDVSQVTVPGQRFSNMTPPSLLLAGHTIVLCCLAIMAATRLARLVARPRVWLVVALGNRGAMTLYLWHLPVLALIIAGGMALGFDRTPHIDGYGWTVAVETMLLLVTMVPVVALLSPLENRPLPWWDAKRARVAGGGRDLLVWLMVTAVGLSILLVARGGVLDARWWLLTAVTCAVEARLATRPGDAAPRRRRDLAR